MLRKITLLTVILHKKVFLRDYSSEPVGKYSNTLYGRIYAPFVKYLPVVKLYKFHGFGAYLFLPFRCLAFRFTTDCKEAVCPDLT